MSLGVDIDDKLTFKLKMQCCAKKEGNSHLFNIGKSSAVHF